jgi:hypothetical protein
MQHSAESNSKIEYLREYKFIFKTSLAHESGDPGVLFAEKKRGSKISWDSPFKQRAKISERSHKMHLLCKHLT